MDEGEAGVDGRPVGLAGPGVGGGPDGHPAHRLDAGPDDDVHGTGHDGLGREVDGLLGRPALAVDGRPGNGVGEPGGQGGVAADVHGLLAHGHGATHDDVLDQGGVEVVALHQGLQGCGGEVDGMPARQLAVATSHRGADCVDDHGIGHRRPPAELSGSFDCCPISGGVSDSRFMDLRFTAEQERFRAEVRDWLEAIVPSAARGTGPLPSLDTAEGFEAHRAWERVMYDARWSVVSWPEEFGGPGGGVARVDHLRRGVLPGPGAHPGRTERDLPPRPHDLRVRDARAEGSVSPRHGVGGGDLVPGLVRARCRERPRRHPEPGHPDLGHAGGGDGGRRWVLNGQKTWCSRGAFADWIFGLFRSDPDAERHRGLTYFLVPMDSPGVTVRPIAQLDGETGFAEVFFEDVEVPATQVLGGVGEGWKVAMATAGSERGLSLRSPARYTEAAARLVELYRAPSRGRPRAGGRVTPTTWPGP